MDDLQSVTDLPRAAALMHPLRLAILRAAQQPTSASGIAAELGLARQNVNYHVRQLAKAGFLRRAGRRRKRNLYEQRYVASAKQYLLPPALLGQLGADPRGVTDALSAAYLLALAGQVQSELSQVTQEAAKRKRRVATLALSTTLSFESAEQRARFADALRDAITDVVGRFSVPASCTQPSGTYRLMLGCHPIPSDGGLP